MVVRMSLRACNRFPAVQAERRDRSCDHEKSSGWLEKACFAGAPDALYFHGSARDISLAQQAQEHEK